MYQVHPEQQWLLHCHRGKEPPAL